MIFISFYFFLLIFNFILLCFAWGNDCIFRNGWLLRKHIWSWWGVNDPKSTNGWLLCWHYWRSDRLVQNANSTCWSFLSSLCDWLACGRLPMFKESILLETTFYSTFYFVLPFIIECATTDVIRITGNGGQGIRCFLAVTTATLLTWRRCNASIVSHGGVEEIVVDDHLTMTGASRVFYRIPITIHGSIWGALSATWENLHQMSQKAPLHAHRKHCDHHTF